MIVAGSASPLLLSSAGGYNLTNSLRFRSSASAYLNRTPATAGNRRTFTINFWLKRGELGTLDQLIGQGNGIGGGAFAIYFDSDGLRVYGGSNDILITNAKFRDPASWYMITLAMDTTQATASNRAKLYINGVEQTYSSTTYPTINTDLPFNQAVQHTISGNTSQLYLFDSYLTEVNFIDGQALTPSSFGETSTSTGVWIPKKYTGTYGTNGFYLPFTDNSALTTSSNVGLGKDFSGNSNYWTTNNISITSGSTYDSMTDVPTLTSATAANYCVMNPINSYSSITVNNGNLQLTLTEAAYRKAVATMAFPTTGTYYLEATVSGGIDYVSYGIVTPEAPLSDAVGQTATGYGAITGTTNWDRKNNGSTSGNFWTISTTNPTLQIAYDATNGKLWLGYNNTWLDSSGGVTGNPSAGTNQTFTVDTTRIYLPSFGGYKSNSIVINLNCGQRPFAYTPPTGFNRLNTFNLTTPTIGATASTTANKYFDVTLYTGNGSTQTITNSGSMQPDWVWLKSRSNATDNELIDAVRGATKSLVSNSTAAEATDTNGLTAFNSNGFALGTDANYNGSTRTYVAWQWRASNATAVTNTAGSITSTVSANTTAGFSIVTYTGNGGTSATVGHGLGVAPSMIIYKVRSNALRNWIVYHASLGSTRKINLNLTDADEAENGNFGGLSPTSTTFGVGYAGTNGSSETFVAYCFAQVAGYSAFGKYTGNGSSDGTFVFTGFRPRFIMFKVTTTTNIWVIHDTARDTYNVSGSTLIPNASDSEYSSNQNMDILSNGFKLRSSDSATNQSGQTFIYAAFAENPFKYANAR